MDASTLSGTAPQAQVLEVNVTPGLAERSVFSAACEASGLSVPAVLDRLIEE